jgi:hypothetical protein
MALLTLGGGNGTVVKNGWQEEKRYDDAQGELQKGP